MSKYLLRYLIFWFPAAILVYFFNRDIYILHILQWFFAFFMLLGWSVNTGMAAYRHPRSALSALLVYGGFNTLIIVFMYSSDPSSGLHIVLRKFGGILSFVPLEIMVRTLKPLNMSAPPEVVVVGFLVCCCVAGYLAGLLSRRSHPDPYSPRIRRF